MAKTKTSFSGHDKFECKTDWVTKGLLAFQENNKILSLSNIEESIQLLGLGINMIKSLNHWMKVLGLVENGSLTQLGKIILQKDLYLESSDTLWLLHWNYVKNQEQSTLANLFFNSFYFTKFTKEEIIKYTTLWLEEKNINLSQTTLKSDVNVLVNMYKNSSHDENSMNLLSDLNIMTQISNDTYTLNINATVPISNEAFLYILQDYIEMRGENSVDSISMDDMQKGSLSIQKILCINENLLYSKIHSLGKITNNAMFYSETSGIRQIYINSFLNKEELLNKIYQ